MINAWAFLYYSRGARARAAPQSLHLCIRVYSHVRQRDKDIRLSLKRVEGDEGQSKADYADNTTDVGYQRQSERVFR